ncbi:hypothetical protein JN00_0063 [Metamycoplasma subdolum]|uniref:RiboL-PSP-HEPN domain-containing protein n=1 Tax=Metamycoplasma subdolum TaxID=92407 RepID=A0A3M0A666_9BACT|nr:hypothetical protein [Metamycoplasma subdolum]RMA79019.1 hypothetical protein JN00_0063 [Metamycoplasma subdolum]WPB50542.1 hypothetical protein R9C05_00040 [Metamycoplasma subdolum]
MQESKKLEWEIYSNVGAIIILSSDIEQNLELIYLYFQIMKNIRKTIVKTNKISQEKVDEFYVKYLKKYQNFALQSMGTTIAAIENLKIFDKKDTEVLKKLLDKRNYFAHNYILKLNEIINSDIKKREEIKSLQNLVQDYKKVSEIVFNIARDYEKEYKKMKRDLNLD